MKRYLFLTLFICSVLSMQAQITGNINATGQTARARGGNSFDVRRLTIGGGIGLQLGGYTAISIAPQIGYDFSKYVNAGAGFSYAYYRKKFDHNNLTRTSHFLGFNIHTHIYPAEHFVIMVQPEINRMWRTDRFKREGVTNRTEEFVPVCLIGGGVRFGPMLVMVQYDVLQNRNSPYGDRIFYGVSYMFRF